MVEIALQRNTMNKLVNDQPDLFTRDRRIQFELLTCRLVQYSETDREPEDANQDDLQDVSKQWFVVSADTEPNSTCLCTQEELKYVTYIKNKFNGWVARIGSTCIEKFGESNIIAEEVDLLTSFMKKGHSVRVNSKLAELMLKQKVITNLELALIIELGQKRTNIEQEAVDTLSLIKAKIAIEKVPPSVKDIKKWILDFLSNHKEEPTFISPYDRKQVLVSEYLISEYENLREKLLIGEASKYDKQTAIKLLGAFYSQNMNVKVEPTREKPNLKKCQISESQVNHCDAEELIRIANNKVENYISSLDRGNKTDERNLYTPLSVLLDAYHRFNTVEYNLEALEGIRDSIASLESKIEKIPLTIKRSVFEVEGKLKENLYESASEMEELITKKYRDLDEEILRIRSEQSSLSKNTANESRALLKSLQAELDEIRNKANNEIDNYRIRIKSLEKSILSDIKDNSNRISSLSNDLEFNQSIVEDLTNASASAETNIKRLNSDLNSVSESAKQSISNLKALFYQWKPREMVLLALMILGILYLWNIETRLRKLEGPQSPEVIPWQSP